MLKISRTNSNNQDFITLVKELDNYLKITDGDEHDFYNQFNNIDVLKHVVVAYKNNQAIACGAFKPFNTTSVEIKRMFTKPEFRGLNIASTILKKLELWALELGYNYSVLETGIRQVEAVGFYKKSNYKIIPNYSQYKNMENSLCFKKQLS
ncbi:GNAT family N-acetyltransferase [Lacinutrix sp. 5H-3-7-4]|uniref:GNAT family N-acetyltransferase n=1 Tax=Lacinutrix sp. (strain 5H-3-7-4) TaxID=983544 RepID=UPI00020A3AC0|nr:GNAT family N-acetyltransferase [Lacinutrix sp. 5H-3-7-4]AEH00081.1 GCN5-related N-acetyltransferase [Lacinutrix sp. 5H-3-7-4]